jgi:hypothetical protein
MDTTLYLTATEKKVFDALGSELRDGWKVVPEKLSCYESLRQISMRFGMADFAAYPELKAIAAAMKEEKPVKFSLKDIPDAAMQELCFTIGARGMNALMQTLVSELKSDEDIEALAALSAFRHKLLEINSTATRTQAHGTTPRRIQRNAPVRPHDEADGRPRGETGEARLCR